MTIGIQARDKSVTEYAIPGGWSQRELQIAGHRFSIVLASDPDKFLDHLTEDAAAPQELRDPYWSRLWPVSETFAAYLLKRDLPEGSPVVEIGCGLGLTGLALLARGRSVVFSDYVPLAIQAALENAQRNGFVAEGRLVDWWKPPQECWPFVVGSDLAYDRTLHVPMLKMLQHVLPVGGQCWLADPGRTVTRELLAKAPDFSLSVVLRDEKGGVSEFAPLGTFQVIELHRGK